MSMTVSHQWLQEWVKLKQSATTIADKLTMAGLEVDEVHPVMPEQISGVVVGEVIEVVQHPEADRLKVCQVLIDTAQPPLGIICGCASVKAGMKVPVATHGAVLPGGHKIKRCKLRGVASNGMLCSMVELGLAEQSDGLMQLPSDAPIGMDFVTYAMLDDSLIEVDLTPNRGDCLSMLGMAREVSAIFEVEMAQVEIAEVKFSKHALDMAVTVEDQSACPRYLAAVLSDIDMRQPTPIWIQERLRRCGMRSVNVVVDVANYVMLELGQPLHAFDREKLDGQLEVRMAKAGEQLILLDDTEVSLGETTLVIADQNGPQAIAGIMGGLDSGVSESTQHILIESAHFAPTGIAQTCRRAGLHSDAAHRFERGVDPELPEKALTRMIGLLQDIVGGKVGQLVETRVTASQRLPASIHLTPAEITRILGVDVPVKTVSDIFTRLAIPFEFKNDTWQVMAPSYRFDIERPADLIEEIARMVGYDQMPAAHLPLMPAVQVADAHQLSVTALKQTLAAQGLYEVLTYSFVSAQLQMLIAPDVAVCQLANPISSQQAVMRSSLWPGLLQVAQHNCRRQHADIRLFETGLCFEQGDGDGTANIAQRHHVAGLLMGARSPEQWAEQAGSIDFYDAKGVVEQLLAMTHQAAKFSFVAGTHVALHPGKTALIQRGEKVVGVVGVIHPHVAAELQLPQGIALFELYDIDQWSCQLPMCHALSKFPSVRRDLSLLVSDQVSFAEIAVKIKQISSDLLQQVVLFDIYQGERIAQDHKSLGIGLIFQHQQRTLVEQEIATQVSAIVEGLQKSFNITVRDR